MKKIFLGMLVFLATLTSAQYDSNNGWGNNNYGDYDNDQDSYYFPDDYYYEFPNDYYPNDYYQNYYNDYRQSILDINWNRFFVEFSLNRQQIHLILDLNRQFNSYSLWDSYYRANPSRWYYDRFYALQQILGPRVFVVFQNRYYNGYSPVVYYTNRCNKYYRPIYSVMPRYRNINVNRYRIDKHEYQRSVGNRYGWNQTKNPHHPGGLEGGYRNDNGNYRNQTNTGGRNHSQGGFRNPNNESRNNDGIRNTGVRNDDQRNNIPHGMETSSPRNNSQREVENRMRTPRNSGNNSVERNNTNERRDFSPRTVNNPMESNSERAGSSGNRSGGFRGR